MTVLELIKVLELYPAKRRVFVDGYEGGYDLLVRGNINITEVVEEDSSYEGSHTDSNGWNGKTPKHADIPRELVLVLGR